MLATMEPEPEPEVMGMPGRVRDMIARFNHSPDSEMPLSKLAHKSPDCDLVDYDLTLSPDRDDVIKPALRPVLKDLNLVDYSQNNNNKVFHNEQSDKSPNNIIINCRKNLRPVANSVILTENGIGSDVTAADSDIIDVLMSVVNASDTAPTASTNGSEPSLVSRNGQQLSVTASKRTLVSQDMNPSPKVDADNRSSSQPMLLEDGGIPTADSFASIDTTPKTPSYMKISCALSGYNCYNTYTSPKQEAKLKVLKIGEQRNGSHSSLSSQHSDSSYEVKNYNEVGIKVKDNGAPMKNGVASRDLLTNGSIHHSSVSSGDASTMNGADHNTILMNGRTEGDMVTKQANDVTDKYVKNLNSTRNLSTTSTPELKLQWEDKRKTDLQSAVSTPSPSKDGHHYFPVLDREVVRIRALCAQCELDLQDESIPEEASGIIRATIGKSSLLINKKFEQFRGLCERNITQSSGEGFQTTVGDLAGFWDMVCLQISDINTMFKDVETMRQSGWAISLNSPVKTLSTTKGSSKGLKSAWSKSSSTASPLTSTKSAPSAKAEEAMKARDLARKRLLAAKRAGRQRKASQSDKDEIEIFVAE